MICFSFSELFDLQLFNNLYGLKQEIKTWVCFLLSVGKHKIFSNVTAELKKISFSEFNSTLICITLKNGHLLKKRAKIYVNRKAMIATNASQSGSNGNCTFKKSDYLWFWVCFIANRRCFKMQSKSLKSVRIRSFSGPYSVRVWENTDQKNSEYWHFHAVSNISLTYSDWPEIDKNWKLLTFRSSHQRCSVKKVFLNILQNSQKNTCARVSF